EWEASVDACQKSLAASDARLATARRRLADADDDLLEDYQIAVRELKEERAALEAELARLRKEMPAPDEGDAALLQRWLERCRSLCQGEQPCGTPEQQNAALREVIAEVRVFPPERVRRGKEGGTFSKVEVELPEWLSRVLTTTAGSGRGRST